MTQPPRPLEGVRACVFDAYGTLFDFASAAARCPDVPEDRRQALTALWRERQCQYTWLRTLEDRYADFWQVTGEALDFAHRNGVLHRDIKPANILVDSYGRPMLADFNISSHRREDQK